MADLPKLASTFKAWRMKISVELNTDYLEVMNRCKRMGLKPNTKGWDEKSRMYIHFVIPCRPTPTVDHINDVNIAAFWEAMKGTTARREDLIKVELICSAVSS
jgi:hypothetical protein